MTSEQCGNCKFYLTEEQTTRGLFDDAPLHPDDFESECRRYPPVKIYEIKEKADVIRDCFSHPTVNVNGWCGEWVATPKTKPYI